MWIWALLVSSAMAADGVLYQAPSAPTLEYRASLKASGEWISPTQDYLRQHPAAAARDRLVQAYAQAQKSFVSAAPVEARKAFESVMALSSDDDWSATEREIFAYSALRLAQLADQPASRQAWLDQALFYDVHPDPQLFPPPLLAELKARPVSRLRLNTSFDSGEWSAILIAGRLCTRFDCPEVPSPAALTVRVTFLSDKWQPQVANVSLGELNKVQPERRPYVHGRCEKPDDFGRRARAFYSLSCDTQKTEPDLQPHLATVETPPWTQPIPESHSRPLLQNKWFWIGTGAAAVVAAAVIIASQRHSHDSGGGSSSGASPAPQPTSTYGY
jgi:hypothetical protein